MRITFLNEPMCKEILRATSGFRLLFGDVPRSSASLFKPLPLAALGSNRLARFRMRARVPAPGIQPGGRH